MTTSISEVGHEELGILISALMYPERAIPLHACSSSAAAQVGSCVQDPGPV